MSHAENQRNYRLRHPERAAAITKASRRKTGKNTSTKVTWRKRYPEKDRAHRVVFNALRNGQLVRPRACSNCGKVCIPQAHHPDYEKPLEVIWLCRPCHLAEDGRQVRVVCEGDPRP